MFQVKATEARKAVFTKMEMERTVWQNFYQCPYNNNDDDGVLLSILFFINISWMRWTKGKAGGVCMQWFVYKSQAANVFA